MNTFLSIIQMINHYLSDYVLVILLAGSGLFFTMRTRFVQVRCLGMGIKKAFGEIRPAGHRRKSGISSFQALSTAIAAQVGTGNIVGASGAILTGGPGALFWMWIIAFFGMATIYAEAVLSQETRKIASDGTVYGGPVYYIRKAFKGKTGSFMANFFAVGAVLALGFMGAMVQSNSISCAINSAFGIHPRAIGIILAIVSGVILSGGIKRISAVTEKMVPLMAFLYILGGIIVIACRISYIPETFEMIFGYAFKPQAIIGGSFGMALKTAVSQGVKRGLFSNEAGMGSTPHAHAVANVERPHDQGVAAMVGVFIDTFVVLTITGLIIISTLYAGNGPLSANAVRGAADGITKNNMVQLAIGGVLGNISFGNAFVAINLLFFSFSSIISWNYFGKINADFLFGKKFTPFYTLIAVVFTYLGSVASGDIVWELTDMFNQLMVLPNVIALWALSKRVSKAAKNN